MITDDRKKDEGNEEGDNGDNNDPPTVMKQTKPPLVLSVALNKKKDRDRDREI